MQVPIARTYVWVDDVAAYEETARLLAHGVVPVLAPTASGRRRRWAHVLDTFGLRAGDEADPAPATDLSPSIQSLVSGAQVVAALDDGVVPVARLVATAGGRSFVPCLDAGSLDDLLTRHTSGSLLLIGRSHRFDASFLRMLAERVAVPWGILTAEDLPALTFAAAKLLAAHPATAYAVIDAANGATEHVHQAGVVDPRRPLSAALLRDLLDGDHLQGLAVFAHGEGGHVNLESVVLCGLVGDEERDLDGNALGGCMVKGEERRCKRAPDSATRVLSFGDLRAARLLLFTCAGSAMAADLYASNVSAVLAAAEGYPAATMVTDRVVAIDPDLPAMLLQLLAQGVGLGPVIHLANDVLSRQAGCRPFILFGDPTGLPAPVARLDSAGRVSIAPETGAVLLTLEADTNRTVIGMADAPPETRLQRGTRSVLLSLPHVQGGAVRLSDETARWEHRRNWLWSVGRQLRRAMWIEEAIRRLYARSLEGDPTFVQSLGLLGEIRAALAARLHRAFSACESVRASGVWSDEPDAWLEECARHIGLWDRHMAFITAAWLFNSQAYNIFADGFVATERRESGVCEHCDSPITEVRSRAPLADQPDQFRSDCPLCGGREAWADGGGRLQLSLSGPLRAGTTQRLVVSLVPPRAPTLAGLPPGLVVVKAHDKGQHCVFFRTIAEAACDRLTFDIPAPPDIAPELHTLQVGWFHGLDGAIMRRRWPGLCA